MNIIDLKDGERIEDLQLRNLRIIQQVNAFRYGMDAVILADFANIKTNMRVCDLGAGSGILSFLLTGRAEGLLIDAVEIDGEAADRMSRSVQLNGLEDSIRVYTGDIREAFRFLPRKYDMVICNPPYHEESHALFMKPQECDARSETGCSYSDVAFAASRVLRNRGRFLTMCPARRMFDMTYALQSQNIHIKRQRFVRSFAEREPYLCLLEGMLQGKPGVKIEPSLIVYEKQGVHTTEILKMYHNGETI